MAPMTPWCVRRRAAEKVSDSSSARSRIGSVSKKPTRPSSAASEQLPAGLRRRDRLVSSIAWHHEGVEGMHATCAHPQVPSSPRAGPAARGGSEAREVATARAPSHRVHGRKQSNK